MAMGIVHVNATPIAYVAVGRSLQEVEARVSKLTSMVVIAWVLCVCVVLVNWLVTFYNKKKD
jgi:NADH:ubiquinone oxidoreductase subunit K